MLGELEEPQALWAALGHPVLPHDERSKAWHGLALLSYPHPSVPFPGLSHVQHHRLLCLQETAWPWISQAVWASCPENSDQSPEKEGQQNPCHCSLSSLQTMDAMDTMLKSVVLNSPGEVLQDILEVWPVQRMGVLELFLTLGGLPNPGVDGPQCTSEQAEHTVGRV